MVRKAENFIFFFNFLMNCGFHLLLNSCFSLAVSNDPGILCSASNLGGVAQKKETNTEEIR